MFKFALFVAVALVAVQGFQARTIEPEFQARGLIEVISGIIQKINDLVSGIGPILTDLISGLIDKIKDITNQIPEIVNQIKKKIEELVAEAGEIGRKCIAAHEDDIEDIVNTARNGMSACVKEAESEVDAIRDQVYILVNKAAEMQVDVFNNVAMCISDANLNPDQLATCLRGLVAPIKENIAELEKEVDNIIAFTKDTVAEATVNLTKCIAAVEEDVSKKQEALINALEECISGVLN